MNTTSGAAASEAVNQVEKTTEVRQLARCGRCGTLRSRLVTRVSLFVKQGPDKWGNTRWLVARSTDYRHGAVGVRVEPFVDCCGRERYFSDVQGKVSTKHLCGAKCLASKGPTCECSCGGKNHGASYEVAS